MGKSWNTDQGQGVFIQELRELIEQYGPSFGEKILNFLVNNTIIPDSYHEAFRVSSLFKRQAELEDRVVAEMVRNNEHNVRWLQKHTDKATGQLRHANPVVRFLSRHFAFLKRYFDNRLKKQQFKEVSRDLKLRDPLVRAVKEAINAARNKNNLASHR